MVGDNSITYMLLVQDLIPKYSENSVRNYYRCDMSSREFKISYLPSIFCTYKKEKKNDMYCKESRSFVSNNVSFVVSKKKLCHVATF